MGGSLSTRIPEEKIIYARHSRSVSFKSIVTTDVYKRLQNLITRAVKVTTKTGGRDQAEVGLKVKDVNS